MQVLRLKVLYESNREYVKISEPNDSIAVRRLKLEPRGLAREPPLLTHLSMTCARRSVIVSLYVHGVMSALGFGGKTATQ